MKQNMKRSLLMILIYCMGIGCLTLFVGALYPVKSIDGVTETMNKDNDILDSDKDLDIVQENDDIKTNNKMNRSAFASTATETPIPSPTPTSTPTPPPVYELKEGGNSEIEKFFNDYYVAWNSCDYGLIKDITSDSDNTIPLIELQNETRFLDDIRDIKCYIMKSYEEGTYIVYVYYELKYVNIKTTLPRLDKFYLNTDKDGNLSISNTEIDDMLKTYYAARDKDEKVQEIIQMTNEKAKEALNNDVDLRIYVEALYNK